MSKLVVSFKDGSLSNFDDATDCHVVEGGSLVVHTVDLTYTFAADTWVMSALSKDKVDIPAMHQGQIQVSGKTMGDYIMYNGETN